MLSQSPTTDDAQRAVVLGRWGPSPAFLSKRHWGMSENRWIPSNTIPSPHKCLGPTLTLGVYGGAGRPAQWLWQWGATDQPGTGGCQLALGMFDFAADGCYLIKKSGTGWCSEFVTGWWTRGINSWTVRIVNPSAGKCLVVSELNLSASFQFAFSDFGWFKKFLGGRPQNEQPIPCLNTTDDQYAFYMYPENCKRTLQMGIMFEPIFWRGRSIILRGWFSIAKVF